MAGPGRRWTVSSDFSESPLGDFIESPLGDRGHDPCVKWARPLVYFRFDADYAESTGGGRLWTPSGSAALATPGVRGHSQVSIAGPAFAATVAGEIDLPDDSVLNLPACAGGDFTLRCFFGYQMFPSGLEVSVAVVPIRKTAAVIGEVGGAESGYALSMSTSGTSTAQSMWLRLLDGAGGGLSCPIAIPSTSPTRDGFGHLVIVFDSAAQTVTTWWNLVKTVTPLAGFIPAESPEPLKVANYSMVISGPPTFAMRLHIDDFGIWDYPWLEQTVRCDYRHRWQF